ncbi:MAG TPA: hypothetical protein VJ476_00730 [Rhizomicrobium sp.]|nr:hypothetical protein [Rhizomicrobium sp.]
MTAAPIFFAKAPSNHDSNPNGAFSFVDDEAGCGAAKFQQWLS